MPETINGGVLMNCILGYNWEWIKKEMERNFRFSNPVFNIAPNKRTIKKRKKK